VVWVRMNRVAKSADPMGCPSSRMPSNCSLCGPIICRVCCRCCRSCSERFGGCVVRDVRSVVLRRFNLMPSGAPTDLLPLSWCVVDTTTVSVTGVWILAL
jgi:hypothetical protein